MDAGPAIVPEWTPRGLHLSANRSHHGHAKTYRSRYISIDKCFIAGVRLCSVATECKPDSWYTAREAAELLGGEVTEATVKDYCKRGDLKAKKVGPKKRWMILGSAIQKLRKKWAID
jgi:hypothetical protein